LAYAEAGVSGYVTCEQPVEDVVRAVKAVARGEMLCTPRVAATLVRHVATLAAGLGAREIPAVTSLTPREIEIVGLIDRGMSNKQIAGTLHIEVATVKNHVHNVLDKLQLKRRGEAAAHLRRQGVAPLAPVPPLESVAPFAPAAVLESI
jgi:DNA-binding NarL/FixJ family response regulator